LPAKTFGTINTNSKALPLFNDGLANGKG